MDNRHIATVELESEATAEDEKELIRRLDDGNNAPGFQTERDGDKIKVYSEF